MTSLKKICSYLWDIPIEKTSSKQNPYLEVVWSQGKKMLNTKNANYSFGNGYKVFQLAMGKLPERVDKTNKVLVLGFGCGSVLHLLRKVYHSKCEIVGIEYDPEIIRLFNQHFNDEKDQLLTLLQADAFEFIKESTSKFDLIIIDLFDDLSTIPMVFLPEFTKELRRISNKDATLIYNTVKNPQHQTSYSELLIDLSRNFREVSTLEFQGINQIIMAY